MKLVFGARHLKFASLVLKPQSGPGCEHDVKMSELSKLDNGSKAMISMYL
jgi:hypothetical protein